MIVRREIPDIDRILSLRPRIIEKDYVLGWMLPSAIKVSNLGIQWNWVGETLEFLESNNPALVFRQSRQPQVK